MMNKIILILFLGVIFISPSFANTIAFQDFTAMNDEDRSSQIYVYYSNGTLAGIASVNNTVTYDGSQDISLVLQPGVTTMFNNPTFIMDWVVSMGYGMVIIISGCVIGVGVLGAAFAIGTKGGRSGGKKWRK